MEKIKVCVVDDNKGIVLLVKEFLDNQEDIEVVAVGHDGKECLDILDSTEVDVLVLDVIMPVIDGLVVMEELNNKGNMPKVIMLTGFGHEEVTQKAIKLGASYFVLKPFDLENLANHIRYVAGKRNVENPEVKKEDIDEKVTEILHELGIPAHIKGYLYLREAVKLVVNDKEVLGKVTKVLYPAIGDAFDTTSSRVERAIRHAIDSAWNSESGKKMFVNALGESIRGSKSKPTNANVIALIAEKVNQNL